MRASSVERVAYVANYAASMEYLKDKNVNSYREGGNADRCSLCFDLVYVLRMHSKKKKKKLGEILHFKSFVPHSCSSLLVVAHLNSSNIINLVTQKQDLLQSAVG